MRQYENIEAKFENENGKTKGYCYIKYKNEK